jgi:acetyl esterase/lipase
MIKRLVSPLICAAALAGQETPPFQVPNGVEVQQDVVYSMAGDVPVRGDLYLPKSGHGPFPAVVYVHGGGKPTKNLGGTKAGFRRQAALMAEKGFVGLSIDYRFLDNPGYPACISDGKAAVRWLRANAKKYGIDPGRIGAAGGSWGGYIVGMLGATPDFPEFEGDGGNRGFSSRVKAVAAFNPALDLVSFGSGARKGPSGTFAEFLRAKYSDQPELWAKASPMTYIGKSSASFLFLHGTRDTTVLIAESQGMMEKLAAAGVHAEIFTAEGAGHAFFHGPPWFELTLKRMEEFFAQYLK